MKVSAGKPGVLIIVENLPVPLDRRVWQEAGALRDAGYPVTIICPQMRGYTREHQVLDGISIYRHWIAEEASGTGGFLREYSSALWGEWCLALRVWRQHSFGIIHLCNPPDLLFLVALPFKVLFGVKVVFDVHDLWPEMFEAKFARRGPLYWAVRAAERMTLAIADVCIATNESVREIICRRGHRTDVHVVRTSPKAINTGVLPDLSLKKGREYLVAYIGVMGNADGVHYILEAAHVLVNQKKRQDIQFLLMGTGPEYENLLALRARLGLEKFVDMPGRVTDEFLCTALKTMDLGVGSDPINPYNDHCTMNKTLEYMAFAKPQVLFGIKEGRVSAGAAAEYVMENSSEKLAEGVEKLLADPVRRAEMGQLGLQRLQTELSWQHSTANLLQTYAGLSADRAQSADPSIAHS